jgi:hypothetical protein
MRWTRLRAYAVKAKLLVNDILHRAFSILILRALGEMTFREILEMCVDMINTVLNISKAGDHYRLSETHNVTEETRTINII